MYQVHTFSYILVLCTEYIPVYDLFDIPGTTTIYFLKGSSMYILTSCEYILSFPDSFARFLAQQVCLKFAANNSIASTLIKPNHTKAGLLLRACARTCCAVATRLLNGRCTHASVRQRMCSVLSCALKSEQGGLGTVSC